MRIRQRGTNLPLPSVLLANVQLLKNKWDKLKARISYQRDIKNCNISWVIEIKPEAPVTRSMKKWSDEADAKLQDCFAITDWNMFWDSSDGIEEYTASVTGFINKCIDDIVPTVTVRTYPNQKPWSTGNICTELKARAAAFREQDSNPEAYKKSCYTRRQTIKQAKLQYRTKI